MRAVVSSDPAEVIVDRQERVLLITWKDGHRSVYSFDDLRRDCPCASCDDARSRQKTGGGRSVFTGPALQRGTVVKRGCHDPAAEGDAVGVAKRSQRGQ